MTATTVIMAMESATTGATTLSSPRNLICHYNPSMVVAALVVSLLGAFTSTQLMSQARGARTLTGVLIWTVLGCLTFGFCGTWCLHFLGMLSCEFDVPIGLNPSLTVLSAVLAVSFTFGALSTDLIQKYWRRPLPRRVDLDPPSPIDNDHGPDSDQDLRQSSEPLLRPSVDHPTSSVRQDVVGGRSNDVARDREVDHLQDRASSSDTLLADTRATEFTSQQIQRSHGDIHHRMNPNEGDHDDARSIEYAHSSDSSFRLSLDDTQAPTTGFNRRLTHNSASEPNAARANNVFVFAAQAVLKGLTLSNVSKGFIWSIALTNMHFMGVKAMDISSGFVVLSPLRVVLCGLISWSVCCVGVILMAGMEVNIKQQLLFSVVAASGVAAVHFSGMYACTFWSTEEPSADIGYPIELPVVIASVAILTCMASTGLLAHSATVARDKLAEVIYTRRRLWAAIAQKESAEAAAAARSEFIASASHEIRTPLHQLQGYADLLLQSELSEEDRRLLLAIQHATRSLTMITSNVLDWSRLEKGEAIPRPVRVDIRLACEAIVHVLPNSDDKKETELIVVVAPEVPSSVLVDETFLQRVLMNLRSNAFKFTATGYVMLHLRVEDEVLFIDVQDSGPGIPKSFLPQLFQPYKQVQARGAERGTGLGLSITKQLLRRMQGTITVDSRYQDDPGVGATNSGCMFTITLPIALREQPSGSKLIQLDKSLRITIVHDSKHRSIEGIVAAWKSYGANISHAKEIKDIPSELDTVIWADLSVLQKQCDTSLHLLKQQQRLVLVPFEDKMLLDDVLGLTPSIHIIPIRKPLIWHRIMQTLIDTQTALASPDAGRHSRLPLQNSAAHSQASSIQHTPPAGKKKTVLLVEDNKINQRLGAKMLALLAYDVLLASDGQEAIDIATAHGATIDVILMDQMMPRKDGITATKEIRALEAAGVIRRRQTIVALTAMAGPEAHDRFVQAGVDVFLSKPLSLAKLGESLAECAGG